MDASDTPSGVLGSPAPGASVAALGSADNGSKAPSSGPVSRQTPEAASTSKKRLRRGSDGASEASDAHVGGDAALASTSRTTTGVVSTFVNVACLYRILARRDRENPLFLSRACR